MMILIWMEDGVSRYGLEDKCSANRPGRRVDLQFFCERDDRFRHFAGGKRERFTFEPQLAPGLKGSFLGVYYPNFVADPGVTSQLSVPRFDLLLASDGTFLDYGSGIAYNPVSPVFGGNFVVTTKEGLAYEIDGSTGDMISVIDPSGNTLTFSDDSLPVRRA